MRCKRDTIRGAGAVAQETLQNPKRELSLRARALVDRGCYRARANKGNELGKEIGGDDGNGSVFSRLFFF